MSALKGKQVFKVMIRVRFSKMQTEMAKDLIMIIITVKENVEKSNEEENLTTVSNLVCVNTILPRSNKTLKDKFLM